MMVGRRQVLGMGAAAIGAAAMAGMVRADDLPLRIGLAGAGSEGIVLVKDAMRADPRVRLVAIADESDAAAWRGLMVFAHPLRKGGVHPQLDMDESALFTGAGATERMIGTVPLDAVLVVGPGSMVAHGLGVAVAAGVDAYVKPAGPCDVSSALAAIGAAPAARGVSVGVDAPWLFEPEAVPEACRLTYARSEGARSRSFAAFLWAREMGSMELPV